MTHGRREAALRLLQTWAGRAAAVLLRPAVLVLIGLAFGCTLQLDWLTSGPSLCPFKLATGLPCPGCGLTRSAVAFLHGDLSASLFYHPLGALTVILAVLLAIVDAWAWWHSRRSGHPAASPLWLLERLARTPAPWVAIGALTVVWVIRLPLYVFGAWTF